MHSCYGAAIGGSGLVAMYGSGKLWCEPRLEQGLRMQARA